MILPPKYSSLWGWVRSPKVPSLSSKDQRQAQIKEYIAEAKVRGDFCLVLRIAAPFGENQMGSG